MYTLVDKVREIVDPFDELVVHPVFDQDVERLGRVRCLLRLSQERFDVGPGVKINLAARRYERPTTMTEYEANLPSPLPTGRQDHQSEFPTKW